jgi:acetyl esterase/lipase
MSGRSLSVVLTGDSAGANISTAMVIKILETRPRLPLPVSLVYAYAALSFHFTSWMPKEDLAVFRQESSSDVAGLLRGKDHFEHRS